MIKTKITELFGINHPIILAGMNWITEPKMVAAVSNAGGLGILAIAHLAPEEIRKQIREIRELTDKPFGVNQVLHLATARENIEIAIQEKAPIINYSLGRPWFIEKVHEYGGKVVGTIAIARHALRAEQLGVDAIIVTGHEAAAHGDKATSMILIPIVANQVKIPLIAAGGFYDGRGLAAALVLGAGAISMGTRFIVTKESIVHDNFKKLILKATEQDTLYSDVFDGMLGRVLRTEAAEGMMKGGFPIFKGVSSALEIKRIMNISLGKFISLSLGMMKGEEKLSLLQQARFAVGAEKHRKAIYNGDEEDGFMFAGQNSGGIDDIPSCKELVERVVAEAEKVLETTRERLHS